MIRDDLSDKLIHLTRGDDLQEAAGRFLKIIQERKLIGGTGYIKGKYTCVCFTEAPLSKLSHILANPSAHGNRYAPYGILVDKKWLYEKGGRPVIYQGDSEYANLPENIKYRHVTYDPINEIDFTWEREWRIRVDELAFGPGDVTLVVPDRVVEDVLIYQHQSKMLKKRHPKTLDFSEDALEPFPWHFVVLSDLGVKVDF